MEGGRREGKTEERREERGGGEEGRWRDLLYSWSFQRISSFIFVLTRFSSRRYVEREKEREEGRGGDRGGRKRGRREERN
jgi:hypothetical protein